MSQPERCDFGGEDKVKVLGMHLMEGKAVSALCEEHKINPSLFYQWQRTLCENGSRAFEGTGTPGLLPINGSIWYERQHAATYHRWLRSLERTGVGWA